MVTVERGHGELASVAGAVGMGFCSGRGLRERGMK